MERSLPILIITPHGGYQVPEELSDLTALRSFDCFIEADTCANEIFDFRSRGAAVIDTDISRLFIDLNCPIRDIPPRTSQGIIKKETSSRNPVFREDRFPDEIAVANLIRRYYKPFHDTLNKILTTDDVKLIIECHTMMPVAPRTAKDSGSPRPLVQVEFIPPDTDCSPTINSEAARFFLESCKRFLHAERESVVESFILSEESGRGLIMDTVCRSGTPFLRLSLSKSLFLTDKYFNLESLMVDQLRLESLRDRLWQAVERFFRNFD